MRDAVQFGFIECIGVVRVWRTNVNGAPIYRKSALYHRAIKLKYIPPTSTGFVIQNVARVEVKE
jgi:hypothetical protein